MIKLKLLVACFICCSVITNATTIVKHAGPEDKIDPRKDYFINVLKLALSKTEIEYGPYQLVQSDIPMYQGRQQISLTQNKIDVLWTGTSAKREDEMLPVKFPLMQGLIGFRTFVINKKNKELFESIKTTQELKQLIAVQGHDWPDTDILKHNGFNVFSSTQYNNLFELMEKSKFDYFPRSILEAKGELEQINSASLLVDSKHLVIYSTAIYFFVDKKNKLLAKRLLIGLQKAKKDGSFDALLRNHKMHKKALDNLNIENRIIHYLDNPYVKEDFIKTGINWIKVNVAPK